ncbi:hypothetical protein A9Q81_08095 [Gammaproteobacteria bacterium 42_54_T18]|nr:hypothetical protein A9Q81_08095 [Gammaproteobacteria bacterium 42_54_T18]
MAQKLLFSIIIPTYNYATKVPKAIRSVLKQNGYDWELIVVNDGSTDNTAKILRELQQNNAFTIVNQKNSGPAATRNKGISLSSGQYLIFLDADDEMSENALNHFRENISNQPSVGIFIGGHDSIYPSGKIKQHLPKLKVSANVDVLKAYLIDKSLAISNGPTAMRRDIFSNYLYPEKFRCTEDIPVFAHALSNFKAAVITESLAKIHKHDDSLRHNTQLAQEIGLSLVDEVFSKERIPKECQKLKAEYSSLRSLSLFRTFFMAGNYIDSRKHYENAIRTSPMSLFKLSYLRKYLKTYVR